MRKCSSVEASASLPGGLSPSQELRETHGIQEASLLIMAFWGPLFNSGRPADDDDV